MLIIMSVERVLPDEIPKSPLHSPAMCHYASNNKYNSIVHYHNNYSKLLMRRLQFPPGVNHNTMCFSLNLL